MSFLVDKIISGGQTGADRGGLDAAMKLGIPHGGWCPKRRRAEDGRVPSRYQLRETEQASYQSRTRRNVLDSDGTVIFSYGRLEGGSLLTARVASEIGKPHLHLDLGQSGTITAVVVARLQNWIAEKGIHVLNVAGSRESKAPGIEVAVAVVIEAALAVQSERAPYEFEEEQLGADESMPLAADPEASSAPERRRSRPT